MIHLVVLVNWQLISNSTIYLIMNEIIEAFRRLIPARHKKNGRGWIAFNCPACGDRRGRGGYLETPSGGFRYRCMNGGCWFERSAGWEPDNGFYGSPRRLFEIMGGDITEIPEHLLQPKSAARLVMSNKDLAQWWLSDAMIGPGYKENKNAVTLDFPVLSLPKKSQFLWECNTPDAIDAQNYMLKRGQFFKESVHIKKYSPLLWSPRYKRHVIIPFINNGEIIGWIARKIDPGKDLAHIKCPRFPSDYMLNQNLRFQYPDVFVVEGAFDAIALRALCTFGNVISKRQANLLNQLQNRGKRIVLIPDFEVDEWKSYLLMAERHGWSVSTPEWPGDDNYSPIDHIKDPGDSIKRNGLLYTLEIIMKSITNNYEDAKLILTRRSR